MPRPLSGEVVVSAVRHLDLLPGRVQDHHSALVGQLSLIVMFVWSFVAHMVLPIGSMGMSVTPGEDAVLAAMKANASGPGLYYLPGYEYAQSLAKPMVEQQKAMEAVAEKAKRGSG